MSGEVDLFAVLDSGTPSPEPGTSPDFKIPEPPPEVEVEDPDAGPVLANEYSYCRDEACGHFLEKHMPSEGGGFIPCHALKDDGTACGCRCFQPNAYFKDGQQVRHFPEELDETTGAPKV